ncbi:MAG: T9SS type A sorting domain-containing protein [Terrimonas sp.]|nr:T9SS type A sorting domain-containing protein [Terrimonas sp.]
MRKLYLALFSAIILFQGINTQAQVSAYNFSQSSGTYTPITGGTVLGNTSTDDQRFVDPGSPLGSTTILTGPGFPIGFNFTYNGAVYDRFAVNANGWISLGQSALTPSVDINSTSSYVPLASTATNTPADLRARIAGMGRDLQAQTGAEIRIETIGSAPNRQCVIQFTNYKRFGTAGTGDNFNFQIILNETSNTVQIVYGTIVFNTTTATSSIDQVGLGGIAATDWNSRTTTIPHDWNATSSASNNTQGCQNATTTTAVTPPASGLTFTWTAPSCSAPGGLTPSAITTNSATVSWTASGSANSYTWEINTLGAGACGTASPGNTGTTATTSVNLTGLLPSTTYTFCIRSSCAGPTTSAWVTTSFTTACAPITILPWTENFDGLASVGSTIFPNCWFKENGDWRSANNSSSSFDANARSAPNFIEIPWSATNEYIWTPGFQLTAGTQYNFSFWYADYDGSTSWVGDIFYNSAQNSTGATLLYNFLNTGTPGPTVYTEVKQSFTPSSSGVYYFAIRVNEPTGNPWYLSFDDFKMEEVPAADIGATGLTLPSVTCPSPSASNLQATIQNFGASTIDFSVNPATVTINVTGATTATLTGTLNTGTLAVGATTTVSVSPAFAFSNSGNYNFAVNATAVGDGNPANDDFSTSKTINQVPVVNLGPDVNECANSGILLNPGAQPAGSSYLWSTNETTANITVFASGTYSVTVTSPLLNGPGKKTYSTSTPVGIFDLQTVNSTQAVSGLLNTSMNANSVDSVCINISHTWDSDMDILLVSPNGTTMDLSIGNGGSGDNYTNTCFTATAATSITGGTPPFTGTYLPEGSFSVFNGQNPNGNWSIRVTDYFTGDQGTINSWRIVFNDSLPAAGTGCPNTDAIDVVVKPEPVVNLGADAVVCQGGTKTLDAGTQPSGSSFLWNTGATTQTIVAATTGQYWVQVTNSQSCFKRDTINVTVVPPTPSTLNLPFDTLYVSSPIQSLGGGAPGGGVYSGTGISGSMINPAAFTQGNHQVNYTYTDQYGCVSSATDVFTVIASSSNKINIFPNPSLSGDVKVVVAPEFVGASVTAYNQMGQKMQTWTLSGKLNQYSLPWPAGRYTLIIRNADGVEVQKELIITR